MTSDGSGQIPAAEEPWIPMDPEDDAIIDTPFPQTDPSRRPRAFRPDLTGETHEPIPDASIPLDLRVGDAP